MSALCCKEHPWLHSGKRAWYIQAPILECLRATTAKLFISSVIARFQFSMQSREWDIERTRCALHCSSLFFPYHPGTFSPHAPEHFASVPSHMVGKHVLLTNVADICDCILSKHVSINKNK